MKTKSICLALFLSMIFRLDFASAAMQKEIVADTGYRALTPANSTYFPNTQISALKDNKIYNISSTGAIQLVASADISNKVLNGLASYDDYFLFSYSGSLPRGVGNVYPNSSPSVLISGGFDSITGMRTAPSNYGGFGEDIFLTEAGNPDVVWADGGAVVGIVRTNTSGNKYQFYDGRNAAIKLYRAMDLAFSPQIFGSYGNRIFVIDSNIQHPNIDNHRILTIASDKTAEIFMDLNDIGYTTDFGSIDFHPTTGELFVADWQNIYRIDSNKNVHLYDSGYSRISDIRFNSEGALFVSDMEASRTYRIIDSGQAEPKIYGLFIGMDYSDVDPGEESNFEDGPDGMTWAFNYYDFFKKNNRWVDTGYDPILILNSANEDSNNKDKILNRIHELEDSGIKEDDIFIFYFLGHGADGSISGNESTTTSTDEYLLISDHGKEGSSLSDDELFLAFSSTLWNSINKIFILDACVSGGFWGNNSTNDVGDLEKLKKVYLYSAAKEDWDMLYLAKSGVPLYSSSLLKGLENSGHPVPEKFYGFLSVQEYEGQIVNIGSFGPPEGKVVFSKEYWQPTTNDSGDINISINNNFPWSSFLPAIINR